MKKNDRVRISIEDMADGGEGIGKADGYTLFVKDAVIGDEVEALVTKAGKHYGYARLMQVVKPSPYRVKPKCPLAARCGGCQLEALSYEQQLRYKERKVSEDLSRIGGVPQEILAAAGEPIVGMEDPYRYRNKVQLPIGTDKAGEPVAGFYAGRTHTLIPVTDCPLEAKGHERIVRAVLSFMADNRVRAYDEKTHTGLVRHLLIRYGFATGEWHLTLVINGRELPHAGTLIDRLKEIPGLVGLALNINEAQTNVILGEETKVLWGSEYLTDRIGDVWVRISPASFYQVNPVQTEKLYDCVARYADLTGTETVWDLYSGIGTISLYVARRAKEVHGVEVVPQAVRDAKENARLNGIGNVTFTEGLSEDVLRASAAADVVILDPPRKGCAQTLLTTLADIRPGKIIYVSCDPATLARDVNILRSSGYEIRAYRPFDCFCQTIHVETVVQLVNTQGKE